MQKGDSVSLTASCAPCTPGAPLSPLVNSAFWGLIGKAGSARYGLTGATTRVSTWVEGSFKGLFQVAILGHMRLKCLSVSAIRAALESEAAQFGWPAMHAQLALPDPISAARLLPNDAQREQRALEVYRISGRPLSSFQLSNLHAQNATDNIAKRQLTWLRSNREKQAVACDAPSALDQVSSTLAGWLNQDKTTL